MTWTTKLSSLYVALFGFVLIIHVFASMPFIWIYVRLDIVYLSRCGIVLIIHVFASVIH
jgi:hypothetical protein